MRVVLDTNVLVSGVFFKGAPFEILQAWHRDQFQLRLSPEIILEYEAVLQRLRDQFPGVDALGILAVVVSNAEVIDAPPLEEQVSADPDDDKFIACAVAAGARFLLSGDRDLLDVEAYGRVRIVKPRAFLDAHIHPSRRES